MMMMIPDTMMIHVILLHFPIFIRFFFTRYNDANIQEREEDLEREQAAMFAEHAAALAREEYEYFHDGTIPSSSSSTLSSSSTSST